MVMEGTMPEKTGEFTVVVTSVTGKKTAFYGNPVDRYEDAVEIQQRALSETAGWIVQSISHLVGEMRVTRASRPPYL
jgi:hypothetical protein